MFPLKPLQPWSKGAWLLLKLTTDLHFTYAMLIMQNARVVEASTKISKEGLRSQEICDSLRILVGSP
jgi:hypothetical protein